MAAAEEVGGIAVRTDVGREEEIVALVERAREAGGQVDLFCSNAGIPGPDGGPEAADEEWERAWRINVMAHVWAARALLPEMIERGDGYLMSTASAAGLLTQVGAMVYSVTKHAAVAVAEWLSITYGDAGIKVSCLCPLGVRTPMLELALGDSIGAAALLRDELLEPEDVAEAVLSGIRDERFLILPHPQVAKYMASRVRTTSAGWPACAGWSERRASPERRTPVGPRGWRRPQPRRAPPRSFDVEEVAHVPQEAGEAPVPGGREAGAAQEQREHADQQDQDGEQIRPATLEQLASPRQDHGSVVAGEEQRGQDPRQRQHEADVEQQQEQQLGGKAEREPTIAAIAAK